MKLNKTFAWVAIVAGGLLAASTAPAQNNTNPPPTVGQHGHTDFAQILNLTEDQKPKFKAIMQGAMEKMKALHTDSSLSTEDKKAKMKAIHEDTVSQMKALLTADQLAKWEKMGPGQRPHHNGSGGGTPPSAPPQT